MKKFVSFPRLSRRSIVCLGLASVLVFQLASGAILPNLLNPDKFYKLSPEVQTIVGENNEELAKKLSYDAEKQLYQYNKDAAPAGSSDSPEQVAAQLAQQGNSEKVGGGADNYSVDLSVDPKKGVTVRDATDKSGSLAISLIPQFDLRDGKQKDGRIIYPLKGKSGHVVYSVKANGLKEDIVLNESPGDDLSLTYQLKLPDSLEAKLLPNGGVGIYSADTTLFGEISYGSDTDRDRVEKARTKGNKTHLVFAIPAPEVVQSGEGSKEVRSKFELKGDQLTVKTTGLDQASYPLSIDPSVVVTSASDFTKGNQEGGIDIDASGHLKRGGLTGGTVPSWTTDGGTSFTTARFGHTSVTYNGYLYVIGGSDNSSYQNDVQYAPINSDGSIGTWVTDGGTSFATGRTGHTSVVHNGYLYVIGGHINSFFNDVQYAPINSDGSIGTWVTDGGTSFATGRYNHTSVVYNGYLYVVGGCSSRIVFCTGYQSDVQYAPIGSDGSIGTWAATTSFTDARLGHASVAINGYLYVIGGEISGPTNKNDVQYAPINSNGTIGSWNTTTSFTNVRRLHTSVAANGYLYIIGGDNSGPKNDIQYAPLNANGTLGSWSSSTSFTNARSEHTSVVHNGYLYVIGGWAAGLPTYSDVQYAQINPAGVLKNNTWSTGNSVASAATSYGRAAAVYNGYMYFTGGLKTTGGALAEVQYVAINADGTLGTWATTTSMNVGRFYHRLVAYEGYLYASGGCSAGIVGVGCNVASELASTAYAQLNSNGTVVSWTAGTNMTTSRYGHGSTLHNGYIYVSSGSGANNTEYAQIDASTHAIGTWATTTNGVSGATSIIAAYNSNMYIIDYSTGVVSVAPINSDGTIGTYSDANAANLSGAMGGGGTNTNHLLIAKGYIYAIDGAGNAQYALINSNGTISSWADTQDASTTGNYPAMVTNENGIYTINLDGTTQYQFINNGGVGTASTWTTDGGTSFTNPRENLGSVAYNGFLYIMGGNTGGATPTSYADVQYAPIDGDGSVGAWAGTTSLPVAVNDLVAVVSNGYIYAVGGNSSNVVYYALICTGSNNGVGGCGSTAGTVGTWNTANSFTTTRTYHSSLAYNGYMYVVGGCDAGSCTTQYNSIEYALICTGSNNGVGGCGSTAGTLGTWTTDGGTSFTDGRWDQSTVAANGYLYVLSGVTSTGDKNDVQYAPLNSDGSVGTWNYTNKIPGVPVHAHSSVVSNGYIYVVGGYEASIVNRVFYAPINSNGTLGVWASTTNINTGRAHMGIAIHNGRIYIAGGCTSYAFTVCTGVTSSVEYAGQLAIPRKGSYSQMFDLAGDAVATKLLWRGTEGCSTSVGYTNAPHSTASFGSPTNALETNSNSLLSLTTSENRYRQLRITLDDSCNSVFPDSLGTASTIQDFELYFHPATAANGSKRLRGGKTFTNETPRSLDAQPQ